VVDRHGTVRPDAPAGKRASVGLEHASPQQARQPVSGTSLLTRGDPAGGSDVRALPAFLAHRRGPAV